MYCVKGEGEVMTGSVVSSNVILTGESVQSRVS